VLSKYTAFVAVEKRTDAVESTMKIRHITIDKQVVKQREHSPSTSPRARGAPAGRGRSTSNKMSFGNIMGAVGGSAATPKPGSAAPTQMVSKSDSNKGGARRSNSNEGISKRKEKAFKDDKKKLSNNNASIAEPMRYSLSKISAAEESKDLSNSEDMEAEEEEKEKEEKAQERLQPAKPVVAPTKASNIDVSALIKAQSFNGSYAFVTLHVLIPALNAGDIKANFPSGVTGNNEKLEAIFITAIICKYFAVVFGGQKTIWELVVKKAKTWIKKESESAGISTSIDWETAAQQLLAAYGYKA